MTFGEQGGVGAAIEECRRILDAYADAGGNTLDTAINYRGGASEEILGELLAGRRESFVVGTTYTVSRDRADPNAAGNARKNLRASLETSLRRLCTDYLDIYWVHMWDRATPLEETMRALDDAVRAGKVLYVGISDAPAWVVARASTLADWRGWSAFIGLQVPCSLTPSQVAIAWTTTRSPAIRPILGVRRLEQLTDNLGALDLVLPTEAVSRLDEATGFSLGFPHDFITETSPGSSAPPSRPDGAPARQWAPYRFRITTPLMIISSPTTLSGPRTSPRNAAPIRAIPAVPSPDQAA